MRHERGYDIREHEAYDVAISALFIVFMLVVIALVFVLPREAAKAKTYSKQVQRACANDYRRYCGEYGIPDLRPAIMHEASRATLVEGMRQRFGRLGRGLASGSEEGRSLPGQGEAPQKTVVRRRSAALKTDVRLMPTCRAISEGPTPACCN